VGGWSKCTTRSPTALELYFDSFVLDATQAGIRQAVIWRPVRRGAYRLAWNRRHDGSRDRQPRVIEFKSTTLEGLRAAPTASRRHRSIPTAARLVDRLRDAGLDSDRHRLDRQGVRLLPPEAQDRCWNDITALTRRLSGGHRKPSRTCRIGDLGKARDTMRKPPPKMA